MNIISFLSRFLQEYKRYRLVWSVLLFLIVLFGYLAVREFNRWYGLWRDVDDRAEDVRNAEDRVTSLEKELSEVQDPYAIEREARENLNLKREGEEVFVVVGVEALEKPEDFSAPVVPSVEEEQGVWNNVRSWWEYFIK
jgi:cell division protein FtsB